MIFLFGGVVHLFLAPNGPALILYTLVACILMGLVLPIVLIRRAFISGAITMFQFGFRSLIRNDFYNNFYLCCFVRVFFPVQPLPDLTRGRLCRVSSS